jgi:alkyl hydroperoxide reductase subunit AhpF
MPGLFAAGDVRHNSIKRCATAVGEGATAVSMVHQYLALAGPVQIGAAGGKNFGIPT